MTDDRLVLTIHFGERDHTGDAFVADALCEVYARHGIESSVILRGIAGFGAGQHLRTDRQLTLSEDLPITSVAVDSSARIEAALADVNRLAVDGLVTVERATTATPHERDEATKLTIYLGRHQSTDGKPAYRAIVDRLHDADAAGATVLLGVDGTMRGARRRASFLSGNVDVPLMVVSVVGREHVARALPGLDSLAPPPFITYERVQICKRDGRQLAGAPEPAAGWQKLVVYASEQAQADGRPLHLELVRRLRAAGGAGATSVRGIWGYHGDHPPHGDTFWQLRRRVPVVTTVVDRAERIAALYEVVDELTAAAGLVTCESVPRAWPRSARSRA